MTLSATARARGTVEAVADNPTPLGESIQYVSPSGMYSHSTLTPEELELTVKGPVDLGRRSDASVADRIIAKLRDDGRNVVVIPHEDSGGEDRKIRCDGDERIIQVVAVPGDPKFLAQASGGSASTTVPAPAAVEWIGRAVEQKAKRYSPEAKARMILAVDIRAAGVLATPTVVESLRKKYGDLCATSGFADIWLAGPSDSRSTRLAE